MTEFFNMLVSNWWGIVAIVAVGLIVWLLLSIVLYKPFFKRFYDILLSGIALIVLSPILLILIILGAIKMGGNPFFTQKRVGKKIGLWLSRQLTLLKKGELDSSKSSLILPYLNRSASEVSV